jgi:hypothetical protein
VLVELFEELELDCRACSVVGRSARVKNNGVAPDPIAAGTFSGRLFHRLNIIYLRTPTTEKPARLRSSEDDNAPPPVLL